MLEIEAEQLIPIFKDRARAARGPYFASSRSPTSPVQSGKPRFKQPFFAYGLILLLTAILLVESVLRLRAGPDPSSIAPLTLFGLGGTQRVAVLDRHEIWRLVTATLLHGGWLHLAGNAMALWFAANLIERLVGWRWFAAIFVIGAVAGTIVSVAVNPPLMVGVGASGGIVGLATATAVLAFGFPSDMRAAMFGGGLRIVLPAMIPFLTAKRAGAMIVDVAAHAGGAVAGALVAVFLPSVWKVRLGEPPFRRLALGIAVAFFGIALASLYPVTGSYEIAKAVAALDPTFPARFKDAIPDAKTLLTLYPRDPRVRAVFAASLVAEGDTTGAESMLANTLQDKAMLEPGLTTDLEPYLRVRLAQLLFDEGKASGGADLRRRDGQPESGAGADAPLSIGRSPAMFTGLHAPFWPGGGSAGVTRGSTMFEPRLPPIAPESLDPDQKAFHDASVRGIEKAFSDGFATRDAAGALIGPWSVWIRDPAVGQAAQTLIAAIAALDGLPKRAHEIIILTIGARFDAAYELYAHCVVAREAGLDERQIAALCAGRKPDALAEEEDLAFDCATALARGGVLPGYLYMAAETAFGAKGLAHLTYLAGVYAFVSILLNAHDVPAPLGGAR